MQEDATTLRHVPNSINSLADRVNVLELPWRSLLERTMSDLKYMLRIFRPHRATAGKNKKPPQPDRHGNAYVQTRLEAAAVAASDIFEYIELGRLCFVAPLPMQEWYSANRAGVRGGEFRIIQNWVVEHLGENQIGPPGMARTEKLSLPQCR